MDKFQPALPVPEGVPNGQLDGANLSAPSDHPAMNEFDVLYRFTQAELAAEGMGLRLAVTRADYVLRDQARGLQEYARCGSLDEVEAALGRRKAALADAEAAPRS